MSKEWRSASELVRALSVRTKDFPSPLWAYWAPGDATRYHVTFLEADSVDPEDESYTALLVQVGADTAYPLSLVIAEPANPWRSWDEPHFLAVFGDRYAGWWAGIRPLLAALGWTKRELNSPEYDPKDAVKIAEYLEDK